MKTLYLTLFVLSFGNVYAQQGRVCNACPDCLPNQGGYYVDWPDTIKAAGAWCSAHAGKVVNIGTSIDDGAIPGYKSNKWNVKLYGKYGLSKRSCCLSSQSPALLAYYHLPSMTTLKILL